VSPIQIGTPQDWKVDLIQLRSLAELIVTRCPPNATAAASASNQFELVRSK